MPHWAFPLLKSIAQDDPETANLELEVLLRWAARDPSDSSLFADARVIASDDGFVNHAASLCDNFMLVAMVGARPGERLVIKYEFEESLDGTDYDDRTLGRKLLEQMSWHPTTR